MAAATSRLQTASGPSSDTMMGTEPGTDSRQQCSAGGGCANGSFKFCSKFSAIKCFTRFDTLHTKIAVPQAALATATNTRPRAWT